jgi:pimeloyl-ACP methyl ester carboxylesterase
MMPRATSWPPCHARGSAGSAGCLIHQVLALSSTSHFIHPVPERGLHKRLRRITASTLAVWGAEDQLTPPSYAEDFAAAIKDARVLAREVVALVRDLLLVAVDAAAVH